MRSSDVRYRIDNEPNTMPRRRGDATAAAPAAAVDELPVLIHLRELNPAASAGNNGSAPGPHFQAEPAMAAESANPESETLLPSETYPESPYMPADGSTPPMGGRLFVGLLVVILAVSIAWAFQPLWSAKGGESGPPAASSGESPDDVPLRVAREETPGPIVNPSFAPPEEQASFVAPAASWQPDDAEGDDSTSGVVPYVPTTLRPATPQFQQ